MHNQWDSKQKKGRMKTPESANCPSFIENLEKMVSGNMSFDEEAQFIDSVRSNVQCLEKLEVEKTYKEFLVKKLDRKCCSQDLIHRINNCIHEDNQSSK